MVCICVYCLPLHTLLVCHIPVAGYGLRLPAFTTPRLRIYALPRGLHHRVTVRSGCTVAFGYLPVTVLRGYVVRCHAVHTPTLPHTGSPYWFLRCRLLVVGSLQFCVRLFAYAVVTHTLHALYAHTTHAFTLLFCGWLRLHGCGYVYLRLFTVVHFIYGYAAHTRPLYGLFTRLVTRFCLPVTTAFFYVHPLPHAFTVPDAVCLRFLRLVGSRFPVYHTCGSALPFCHLLLRSPHIRLGCVAVPRVRVTVGSATTYTVYLPCTRCVYLPRFLQLPHLPLHTVCGYAFAHCVRLRPAIAARLVTGYTHVFLCRGYTPLCRFRLPFPLPPGYRTYCRTCRVQFTARLVLLVRVWFCTLPYVHVGSPHGLHTAFCSSFTTRLGLVPHTATILPRGYTHGYRLPRLPTRIPFYQLRSYHRFLRLVHTRTVARGSVLPLLRLRGYPTAPHGCLPHVTARACQFTLRLVTTALPHLVLRFFMQFFTFTYLRACAFHTADTTGYPFGSGSRLPTVPVVWLPACVTVAVARTSSAATPTWLVCGSAARGWFPLRLPLRFCLLRTLLRINTFCRFLLRFVVRWFYGYYVHTRATYYTVTTVYHPHVLPPRFACVAVTVAGLPAALRVHYGLRFALRALRFCSTHGCLPHTVAARTTHALPLRALPVHGCRLPLPRFTLRIPVHCGYAVAVCVCVYAFVYYTARYRGSRLYIPPALPVWFARLPVGLPTHGYVYAHRAFTHTHTTGSYIPFGSTWLLRFVYTPRFTVLRTVTFAVLHTTVHSTRFTTACTTATPATTPPACRAYLRLPFCVRASYCCQLDYVYGSTGSSAACLPG